MTQPMTFKPLLALAAFAFILPVSAQAETIIRETRITPTYTETYTETTIPQKQYRHVGETTDGNKASDRRDAMARMKARQEAEAIPMGQKVTTIYKGQRVTTTYVRPAAPVSSGPNTWPTEHVYVPVESTVETTYTRPGYPADVTPHKGHLHMDGPHHNVTTYRYNN